MSKADGIRAAIEVVRENEPYLDCYHPSVTKRDISVYGGEQDNHSTILSALYDLLAETLADELCDGEDSQ